MTQINETHLGFWCPVCANPHGIDLAWTEVGNADAARCWSTLDRNTAKHISPMKMIPVFAPLATPIESTETRDDMERHAEVVVFRGPIYPCESDPGINLQFDHIAVAERGYGNHKGQRSAASNVGNPHHWGCHRRAVKWAGDVLTEADAVLYVVEGKLGGAE